jgi:hypothetical protein
VNPSPSGPSKFSRGTRQSLKITSEVSLARIPSLFSFFPGRNPAIPFSRMNALIPCDPLDLSVTAIATQKSA